MSLLSVRNLTFTHGGPLLFDEINFAVESGERIGLVGRNGTGKSTLLKLLCGELIPDDGSIIIDDTVTIGRLIQEVPDESHVDVASIVRQGLNVDSSDSDQSDWKHQQKVDRVLSRLHLQSDASFASLSSGMKRRVLLAQTLVSEPDVLLLDEPTNHLDVESIAWLERFLNGYSGAIIFVTHDRVFLQQLAIRIIEIDRARLFDWTCDYNTFLARRQELLDSEAKQDAAFDRRLAEEEVWIRKGIKARRTRNEGRVRALKNMRKERSQRRIRIGNVRMETADGERSGQLVLKAKEITFAWEGHPVVAGFSTSISRGDRVGIIGPNGAGKTTLVKILLGELTPSSGSVRTGTNLQIIYFDQLRESIDETRTVVENIGEGQDTLQINGRNKHVYGYLQDFLFTPERARRPARYLSGGEQNRLMLAKLFRQPSNVMVLDEPTNDLDAETLELLEELVSQYSGTVLLISHDRAFLNNVVTSTIAFDPDGVVREYDGGYDDYLRQRPEPVLQPEKKLQLTHKQKTTGSPIKTRLSYKEQRELDGLPDEIAALEDQQSQLHEQMADPEFYRQDSSVIAEATASLQSLTKQLEIACSRWEELEELHNS
ncbi:MAG: ATP-binding cassette domain-containing protein [Fuerstiella sp.]|nr:ATP-binding cassette domain-containing protein [Fuerstiella sp.]